MIPPNTCYVYQVQVRGTATIGDATSIGAARSFALYERVGVRGRGYRTNLFEFFITSGRNLNASAEVGVIELMTNSHFSNNLGIASNEIDLATTSTVGNQLQMQLLPDRSFILPPPNTIVTPGIGTQPGGLAGLGNPYLAAISGGKLAGLASPAILALSFMVARAGGVQFTLGSDQRSISGVIQIVGTGLDNVRSQGRYQAIFQGSFIGAFVG